MQDLYINKIVSKYLPKGEDFRSSCVKNSNWLYKIEPITKQSIMVKVFNREAHFIREKTAYKILNMSSVKIPHLIDTGGEGSLYWIIYYFVEGERLSDIDNQSFKENHELFYEIGYNLGKIHACNFAFLFTKKQRVKYIKRRQEKFISGARYYKEKLGEKYPNYIRVFEQAMQFLNDNVILFSDEQDFNFIKGDFCPNNIIVKRGRLEAFIDFEFFMFENRYRDFIHMNDYFEYNKQFKISFFKGYLGGINKNNFELLSDKLMLMLVHYNLESCFTANKYNIDRIIKCLKNNLEKSNKEHNQYNKY